jgi:hypothetical protein
MTLADTLSRLPNKENRDTLELDVRVDLVRFSTERLSNIREATNRDSTLNQLCETITTGWPDTIQDIPTPIRSYWSYRDELFVENGIVLKGTRVVVPQEQQQVILEQLHYNHQSIGKTRLRAKDSVYWNGINKDIENMVKSCVICQEHQPTQPSKTLLPHEIPSRPWEIVGTDLFHFDNSEYLIVADYYSKSPFIRKFTGQYTSSIVVAATKQIFSEHGIPTRVISDNGPQYASETYRDFARQWCFDHVTSSPRYPQANAFIERQIRTVKSQLLKSKQAGTDPDLAMLCLRTTPISQHLPSPGELLSNRKLRANTPVKITGPQHSNTDHVLDQLQQRQDRQKLYHDRTAHDLPPIMRGQAVRVQDHDTSRWHPATVVSKCSEPRSYIIETPNGRQLRRNRVHLRESTNPVNVQSKFRLLNH